MIPPWEADGLPPGVEIEDLDAAARYIISGIPPDGGRIVFPRLARPGQFFRLSGTDYGKNPRRIAELAAMTPLHQDRNGRYYPAVLLPDPTDISRHEAGNRVSGFPAATQGENTFHSWQRRTRTRCEAIDSQQVLDVDRQ